MPRYPKEAGFPADGGGRSYLNGRWIGVSLGAVRAKQSESEPEIMTGNTIDAFILRRAKTTAKNSACNIGMKSTRRTESDQFREGE